MCEWPGGDSLRYCWVIWWFGDSVNKLQLISVPENATCDVYVFRLAATTEQNRTVCVLIPLLYTLTFICVFLCLVSLPFLLPSQIHSTNIGRIFSLFCSVPVRCAVPPNVWRDWRNSRKSHVNSLLAACKTDTVYLRVRWVTAMLTSSNMRLLHSLTKFSIT